MRFATLPLVLTASTAAVLCQTPNKSEIDKLVKEFVELDFRSDEGLAREKEILARLDDVPPLSPRDAASWQKKILNLHRRGRKLEKSGRNWFWEDEKRGLYYVGGETGRPKGLLIGLHGGGQGSGDAGSSHSMYTAAANKLDWVTVCPEVLVKSEHGWTDNGTDEFVFDLIDAALRTWKIDPDHVYFAGHSMGGYGSWTLGAWYADRVAGLAPSAGAPTPLLDASGKVSGIIEGVIPNLRNVAMVVFQSTDDPRVPPEPNQVAVKLLGEAQKRYGGYDFEYWEVGDRGHGLPDGGAAALLAKISDKVRQPVPDRVTWQPMVRWKRQFYWLHWDNPYTQAMLDARIDREANKITVDCEEARKGLAVLLDERVVRFDEEVVIELNGTEVFRGKPERRLSTLVLTGRRPDPQLVFQARIPLLDES